MIRKLQRKLIAIIMVIVFVMLLLISCMIVMFTQRSLENESVGMLQQISTDPLLPQHFNGGKSSSVSFPYFIIQRGKAGEFIVSGSYDNLEDNELILSLAQEYLISSPEGPEAGLLKEYKLRYLRTVGRNGEGIIFIDVSSEISTLSHLVQIVILVDIFSLAAFFLISLFLARQITKPVEEAWTKQKQFVSDASHELKTPLTVILTNAELIQDDSFDSTTRNQFAANILTMSSQMRGLVESLLELARVDNGAVLNHSEQLDFSTLITNAVLPYEPMCFEKGLILETKISEGIRIRGSEAHLRQVLGILLDNAQKYASNGGKIEVSLQQNGKSHCRLTVSNEGPEIPQDHLTKIFERFYREDSVRTMNHSYGLGLSIAQSIINEHNGTIYAESKNGINSFIVELPTIVSKHQFEK